jgi:hypothetical protein
MGSGFSKMKKQAKMMQEQMQMAQDKMKKLEVNGQSGGGLVSLTLSGSYELLQIKIQKECVDVNDLEGLQDLILLAHKDALKKLQEQETGSFPFSM